MRDRLRTTTWVRLALCVFFLLPLVVVIFLPVGPVMATILWLWLMLMVSLGLIWVAFGRGNRGPIEEVEADADELPRVDNPEAVREIMEVCETGEKAGVLIFRGELREPPEEAYQRLKQEFGGQTVPLLQEDPQWGAAILLMPKPVEKAVLEKPARPWLNWLLLVLTLLTTTWVGAAQVGVNLLREPGRFATGLPYSLALLGILGVHELGHFFAARRHGMNVTPPYFIPVPFALGTFGAFIKMRSPPEDRRALFDVAVAGPLAGLVVAIPALLIGLHYSTVIGSGLDGPRSPLNGASAGSSILYAILAKLSLGPALAEGDVLSLSPLAYAGWLGLLITALNLLPIGQLDGGHTTRAMSGTRVGQTISTIAMWALFLVAIFVWPSLIMWAFIVFFIAGRSSPPLNDLTPITPGRRLLGYFTFFILALILIPLPISWWHALGIYNPYR
jgi:membrane-associated protease RseP (regulator of RpoE activity)